MNETENSKVWQVWETGQSDPQYQTMLMKMRILERKYDAVLQTLPEAQRDIVCDYVALCEEMSWRMLETACEILTKTPGA